MSTQFCACDAGLQNLGVTSCSKVLKTIKKHLFVPLTDKDGNRNSILLTDFVDGVLPDSYIAGKLYNTDATQKWYSTPNLYEFVEPSRTDTVKEEAPSGLITRIQGGVQQFKAVLLNIDSQIAGKILASGCSDFGVYEVDKTGAIRGEMSVDGSELFPIEIEKGSLDSFDIPEVEGSASQRVQVEFQFSQTVNEQNLRIIQSTAIGTNLLKLNGVIDGELTILAVPAVTAITFTASLIVKDFGFYGTDIPIQGKTEPADWLLLDATLTPVVISDVTESTVTPGNYDFTFTSTAVQLVTLEFIEVPTTSLDQGVEANTTTTTTP